MGNSVDILMITYNRPRYTQLSLQRLLDTCDERMRVWVWHNGTDEETIKIVKSMRNHPRFYMFHHSVENKKLNEPTNWLWENSNAKYFSKIDDDCIVPYGWAETLMRAHQDISELGIIACWHFMEEDIVPELIAKKVQSFSGGHSIMRNCWVGGSGYLMKRECFEKLGPIQAGSGFTKYGIELSLRGYICGWYYPFLYQEHMDDPRSNHTLIKTDDDLKKYLPLTAQNFGVKSIQQWVEFLRKEALVTQTADINPKIYVGWRRKIRNLKMKLHVFFIGKTNDL